MKPGTPGFIPERLREAREARGLNGIAFADLVGVTRQAVSGYEKGVQTPAPAVMRIICDKLGLPMQFFLRPACAPSSRRFFYRSMSTATKAQRCRAERRFGWLTEVVDYLRTMIVFPDVDFPKVDGLPDDPSALTDEQIEDAAQITRRGWGLGDGPISNIVWLLENKGAIVTRQDLGADKLDAFSQWRESDETPYVVLGTEHSSAVRSRFDAAHELAHMVLHRSIQDSALNKPATYKLMEDQAHRFSSAFLLPARTFAQEFHGPSIDGLVALKSRWRVSIAGMIMRASQLRLISEQQEKRFWIMRSRRGWHTQEPLDDRLEAEEPRFIRRCFEMLIKKGCMSPQEVPLQLGLPVADIEGVTSIRGVFQDVDGPELHLTPEASEPRILRFPATG